MRFLPWHHSVRNALRRPLRSALLVLSSGLVTLLFVGTAAFVRSLRANQANTAPPSAALLISTAASRDIIRSTTSVAVAELVGADVRGVVAASPEIHMATNILLPGDERPREAFVRGVTERAFAVHEAVTLIEGRLAGPGEVLVGRLAAAKSQLPADALTLNSRLSIEGGMFTVAGTFAAPGTTIESEIWMSLSELQGWIHREDCSCVFVRLASEDDLPDVDLFARRRLDLELESIPARVYYEELATYFRPILALVVAMAVLIGAAATAGGANMIVTMAQDRSREMAILRTLGFRNGAVATSFLLELLLLALAGGLLGVVSAQLLLQRVSVSLAMTAFRVEADAVSAIIGLASLLLVVIVSAIPALFVLLRTRIVTAHRAA